MSTVETQTPDGYYAVRYNDLIGFYVLRTTKQGKWAGHQWLNRYHSDWAERVSRVEEASVRATIAADPVACMRAFAAKYEHCGRCNRALTDPESRAWGIGPECRDILGLYGEPPRVVDREGDVPTAEKIEPPLAVQVYNEPGHYDGSITVADGVATLVSPYDPNLVSRVRSIKGRNWDSVNKVWTFPAHLHSLPIAAKLCETFNLEPIGFDPATIEIPGGDKPEEQEVGKVFIENGRGALVSGYDKKLVERIREIPGRRWEDCGNCFHRQSDHASGSGRCEYCGECPEYVAKKQWTFPVIAATADEIADIARTFKLEMTGDMAVLADRARTNKEHSRAATADFHVAGLRGELLPFQRAGVRYATENKRVIIADEMGLGKTIQALATIQHLESYPALVIVPSLSGIVPENWRREIVKWLPGRTTAVLSGKTPPARNEQRVLGSFALPRSLSDQAFSADVVIINYDILGSYDAKTKEWGGWAAVLKDREWAAVIIDESQYMKNGKAARSKAAKALCRLADVRLLTTGTPIMNRAQELQTQIEALDRMDDIGGYLAFKRALTGTPRELQQLNERLRAVCYLRRTKADVMPELPPKRYVTLPIPLENEARYREHEKSLVAYLRDRLIAKGIDPDEAITAAKMHAAGISGDAQALVMIGALKRTAAEEKLAATKEWVEDFLASGKKLLLFVWHREIAQDLADHFGAPAIMGGMKMETRKAIEDRFQTDPDMNLLVLNIQAGGIAITLTEASDVAFMEFPWRPTDIDQAADRAYGRVNNPHGVTVWYLAAPDTIDEFVCSLLDEKRPIVQAVTDGEIVESMSIVADLMAAMMNQTRGAA